MSAYQRQPGNQASLRAQITWFKEQMDRDDKRFKDLMQRGQIKPESVEYHQRHQRGVLASLEAAALIEYGSCRRA